MYSPIGGGGQSAGYLAPLGGQRVDARRSQRLQEIRSLAVQVTDQNGNAPSATAPRYPRRMLAAEVWHWWIGVALTGGVALLFITLIGAYLKSVSSQKYPGGKRRRQSDL